MTNITSDTKAVVMLCSHFSKKSTVAPLTPTEYRKVAKALWEKQKRPADLFNDSRLLDTLSEITGIDSQRLRGLMGRRVEMGLALEEWTRHGIWVISKSDLDYPANFRLYLKNNNPPLLYGIGDRRLLTYGGLGFVGSRDVDEEGIRFTKAVANLCVKNAKMVISGGAKGVDKTSVEAALAENGYAIAVLADNLLKNSLSPMYRDAIANGHLLLLSPYHPDAPFSVGNAMGRNKLIYALADFTLVVSSDYNKGGTWAGAKEELNRPEHKKVFVRIAPNVPAGNKKLLELGAISWPEIEDSQIFWDVLKKTNAAFDFFNASFDGDLFEGPVEKVGEIKNDKSGNVIKSEKNKEELIKKQISKRSDSEEEKQKHEVDAKSIVYQKVLPVLLSYMQEPISIDELAEILCVTKTQMAIWIKKAENQQYVHKFTRPTKYQAITSSNFIFAR